MRIVSLLPAATEICFALGLGDEVVGVSAECDYPPAAKARRVVSRPAIDLDGRTSRDVSLQVGRRLENGGSLYAIDEAALNELEPDVVLTQAVCDVCAPSWGDVRDVASRLRRPPDIVSLDPHRLNDVLSDIRRVGDVCEAEDAATSFIEGLQERIGSVEEGLADARSRPKILCLEWFDPLFVAGHWVPDMVALAGGEDVLASPGEASRRVTPKDIVLAAPEVILLAACGFDLARAGKEASVVTAEPWWADLPATRSGRVWIADGSAYFSRPGPRLVNGIELLAAVLHPERFAPPGSDVARIWT